MSKVSSNAIAEITAVIARVTRTLSGRSIEVIQQGMRVGVEYDKVGAPVRVYLPSLADNPSPELVHAVQGFLDKEVSGLLYTNHGYQAAQRRAGQFASGMAGAMQSIIEDCRTEREMKSEFRGSAVNFQRNHDFAIKHILEEDFAKTVDANQRKAMLAMPAIRAASGELAYQEFMEDKWEHLDTLGGAILHYANDIQDVDATENTFDLTRKILRKWEELEKEESDGGSGKSPSPTSARVPGPADGSPTSGSSAEESSDPDDAGMSDHDEMHRENKDRELHDRERNRDGGGSGTQDGLSLSKDLDDAFEKQEWNKRVEERIKTYAKEDAGKSGAYVPYSRRFDYVGPFPNETKVISRFNESTSGKYIYEAASKSSHIIQQQIQKLFMAKSLTRWEPGLKRGRINSASLHKLAIGDPRVFRRKIESDSRELAVSLLIDMSGSMYGSKVQYAAQAALMFSDVLTKLGIQHEVSAFTTFSGRMTGSNLPSSDDVNSMLRDPTRRSDGISYARYSPIVNFIAKGYSERLNEEKRKLIAMIPEGYSGMMANNVDGESVEIVGRRLLARKETRKVMIVMSDGSPAADGDGYQIDSHLKQVVKSLSSSGVEMLGLGLLDGSVKRYYPKHSVVSNVEEIPTKILELTRMMVVGA